MEKLEKSEQKPQKSWRLTFFRAVAVLAIVLGGATLLKLSLGDVPTEQYAELPEELQEAENYYLAKCDVELEHFNTHHVSNSPVDIAETLEELEKEYADLKKEMAENPGNKQVMAALVQNLQLRLQLLERINRLMEKEEVQTIDV